jgi:hypothetical protein
MRILKINLFTILKKRESYSRHVALSVKELQEWINIRICISGTPLLINPCTKKHKKVGFFQGCSGLHSQLRRPNMLYGEGRKSPKTAVYSSYIREKEGATEVQLCVRYALS